ncbi:hypothetical protein D3C78_1772450 [compost metagenome]
MLELMGAAVLLAILAIAGSRAAGRVLRLVLVLLCAGAAAMCAVAVYLMGAMVWQLFD